MLRVGVAAVYRVVVCCVRAENIFVGVEAPVLPRAEERKQKVAAHVGESGVEGDGPQAVADGGRTSPYQPHGIGMNPRKGLCGAVRHLLHAQHESLVEIQRVAYGIEGNLRYRSTSHFSHTRGGVDKLVLEAPVGVVGIDGYYILHMVPRQTHIQCVRPSGGHYHHQ